jgi:hypothetical protein
MLDSEDDDNIHINDYVCKDCHTRFRTYWNMCSVVLPGLRKDHPFYARNIKLYERILKTYVSGEFSVDEDNNENVVIPAWSFEVSNVLDDLAAKFKINVDAVRVYMFDNEGDDEDAIEVNGGDWKI